VGDYVQDGEQLAVVTDAGSFGFVLNLPYELHRYVTKGQPLEVELTDGTKLKAVVSSMMPNVDSSSQTQAVFLRVAPGSDLPQNLIAKVRIVKAIKPHVPTLPKAAVLTNEAQTSFWVMKMIDSVTAVRVPIVKGMETKDRVEIVRPNFNANDQIISTGNYGLGDTARVKIVKGEE
jgi:HlyD family secretion protein